MAWYQRFEYAIGHWLQKATEHMVGCVLCSPGCFSLFRGRALMEDNIMAKYTTLSTEARHYVQYDQGRYSPSILQSLASALSFGVTRGHDPKQLPWGDLCDHKPRGHDPPIGNAWFRERLARSVMGGVTTQTNGEPPPLSLH